ncbi:short-chain dehydrogenase [Penicillium odoratum]|uniref:short-chain dehydrogenase n=1 Tax=Penicillium odoratum TaxID=1167516 RepID=UPI0025469A8E|nr:short-chain dehydrogenase [Penicillium odoratum]KAJ5768961.1 short-chain dehydrogenase [Penicillium odoratum]
MPPFPSPTKKWHTDTYPSISPRRPEVSMVGRKIVVTGGGDGIGASIARSFAKAGAYSIALIGRRRQVLEENKSQILAISSDIKVLVLVADISSADDVNKAFQTIKEAVGSPDVLVSNAAYFAGASPILEETVEQFASAVDTNVKGPFFVLRAFMSVANPSPTIVSITSAIAHVSSSIFPGFSAYAATKIAGLRIFDYAQSENPDMHVVHIHPGQVMTSMSKKVGMEAPIDTGMYAAAKAKQFLPHGKGSRRLTLIVELPADFAVWAASPEAKFLKGKVVWANWDVDELKAREEEIANSSIFTIAIEGWPFLS